MRVELLFWDGCPSHPKALIELREAMVGVALDPSTIVVREVETESEAALERFVGSPTIRIDGVDVQPPGEEPVGLTCRVYHRRDGRISPTPDPADVHDALLAARTATIERKQMTAIGDPAPTFALPDTGGTMHEPGKAPATVVVFTCNHCPYALAWHERIVGVARDYADRGVEVLAVNPNDAERYPRDSPEAMRVRVESGEFEGVPYLYDESQRVAHAYGAKTTPDVFVLDAAGVLRYRGAPDADHDDPAQNAAFVRGALAAVLDGRDPNPVETPPVGCSIKWKS